MAKLKDLEVGQVWENEGDNGDTRKILGFKDNGDVMYRWRTNKSDGIVFTTLEDFMGCSRLITSADGTPVKQWEEIDQYEGMIAVGQNRGPISCRVKGSVPSDAVVNEWTLAELVYVEDGDYPFVTAEGDFKYCQIEVKND